MTRHPSPADPSRSPTVLALRQGLQLKGNSLLMTLFGDAIALPNKAVWLRTLIHLAGQLGLSPRLVRTSAYRLVADDWLLANREGRRSYYTLSPNGARRVQHAQRRIFDTVSAPSEMPLWTVLMVSPAFKSSARRQLQRELAWNGYGQVADGVYAHTQADRASLQDMLQANHATDHVCVLNAHGDHAMASRSLHALQTDIGCVHRLERAWERFNERFAPLLTPSPRLTDGDCFLVRTLLVHEFRRILQRQPILPTTLQTDESAFDQAHRLFHTLYQHLRAPSERFLDQTLDGCPLTRAPSPHPVHGAH